MCLNPWLLSYVELFIFKSPFLVQEILRSFWYYSKYNMIYDKMLRSKLPLSQKYLALKIQYVIVSRLEIRFQSCFSWKTRLNPWKSYKHKPLFFFVHQQSFPSKSIGTSYSINVWSPPIRIYHLFNLFRKWGKELQKCFCNSIR